MLLLAEQSSRRLPPGLVQTLFCCFCRRDYSSLFDVGRNQRDRLGCPYQAIRFLRRWCIPRFATSFDRVRPYAFLRATRHGAIRSLQWSIAETRVTTPYGITIMGCELLRACFQDRPFTIGDVLRLVQRRALAPTSKDQSNKDQFRTTLDGGMRY
jgi:hypothetical protein